MRRSTAVLPRRFVPVLQQYIPHYTLGLFRLVYQLEGNMGRK